MKLDKMCNYLFERVSEASLIDIVVMSELHINERIIDSVHMEKQIYISDFRITFNRK